MPAERRWTQDDRHIVWTAGDFEDHYNLYVGSYLVGENLPFEEWYALYNHYNNYKKAA